jgi:hypothetical protein
VVIYGRAQSLALAGLLCVWRLLLPAGAQAPVAEDKPGQPDPLNSSRSALIAPCERAIGGAFHGGCRRYLPRWRISNAFGPALLSPGDSKSGRYAANRAGPVLNTLFGPAATMICVALSPSVWPSVGEQLATCLRVVPARHRLVFRFLAATVLRFSELCALQWRRHLHLDGRSPRVNVRRAAVRGRLEPPRTRHGRREVPFPNSGGPSQARPAASHLPLNEKCTGSRDPSALRIRGCSGQRRISSLNLT